VGDVIMGEVIRIFGRGHRALGANPTSHIFIQAFIGTGQKSQSLELLIGFLAHLEPKLWLQNPNFGKKSSPTKGRYFG